ncbi:MAG: sulfite exporter TauE/SafE family protein [Balneolaceae bacterium]|nr:sulfite exporter TauE/SafE family protein [Balneolaceae bacterium]
MEFPLYLLFLFLLIAFIYGSVGHGGASGYIAVLTLTGYFSPELVPVVLILNILVSSIALYNYGSRGHFEWTLFWPFAVTSIPAAFLGGYVTVGANLFFTIVGMVLLLMAGIVFLRTLKKEEIEQNKPIHVPVALLSGLVIGFISGLIGVGGGIFLTPFMLFLGWGKLKNIAAVSALFILVNSTSGIIGHAFSTQIQWPLALYFVIPVVIGGFIGSRYGVKSVKAFYIQYLLSIVLLIAGIKMLAQFAF